MNQKYKICLTEKGKSLYGNKNIFLSERVSCEYDNGFDFRFQLENVSTDKKGYTEKFILAKDVFEMKALMDMDLIEIKEIKKKA